jgi:outer membrane lipoprotein SlyB
MIFGRINMNTMRILAAAAVAAAVAVTAVQAQQTQRVRGTIEKVDGNTLLIKSSAGDVTLTLTDNALVVGVVKATLADIKEGSYIGSGALPQPDGTQKAVEVHIFAESMRGTGDGHRTTWDGAPGGAMTNGAVGQTVSSVDGPAITVKYKDGEKKVIVGPNVPIVRYEIGDRSELKPGAAVSIVAAAKKPDGTFTAGRINVGRDGIVPM